MIVSGPLTKCDDWITVEDFCCKVDKADDGEIATAIEAATDYLWRRTGCKFTGECETTLRPTLCSCGGGWGGCGCYKLLLEAPGGLPILSIEEVRIDGVVQDEDNYALLAGKWFVPRNINFPIYPYQDLNVAPGQQNSWEIDITYGEAVPALGKIACEDFANELLKSCKGEDCALPHGVTSVTRDDTTYNFESITTGYTNIQTVDLFLSEFSGYVNTGWSGFGKPGSPTIIVET